MRGFRTASWAKKLVTGVCVSTLLQCLLLLSPATAATVVLGVARNSDNAAEWSGISDRLQTAKVAYRIVELSQVQKASELAGITVLFLPNIETLTASQTLAIEEWVSQGGRVIVSGPVGRLSPLGVRQALRSLLGAYWAFPLSEPASLQTITTQPQAWVRKGMTADSLWGGVLMPSSLNSQTVATWKAASLAGIMGAAAANENPPAVVTTERATFLGWNWGRKSSGSAAFDSAWLRAALTQYGEVPAGSGPVATIPSPDASSPTPAPTAQATTPTQAATSASSPAATPNPARASDRVAIRQAPSALISRGNTPLNDPAEQVAPPGLEVEPGTLPIATLEAIAMRQELENLIGRVESALLSANALNWAMTGQTAQTPEAESTAAAKANLVATSNDAGLVVSKSETNDQASQPNPSSDRLTQVLTDARQGLKTFSQLIAQGNYRQARSQWLTTRQLLWDNYPLERLRTQPEIRAIWLDRGTIIRAGSEQGLAKLFDRWAAAGINTVFIETVNAGYPIYPSKVAPQQNPLTRNWDPLAASVKLAHARKMELHAWIWAFAAGNDRHNAILNLPKSYPGPVIAANPDWANYDNRGQMIPVGQGKPFLDPANPEVRRYLLSLVSEIATRYPVDGIQLDYIRYPFQDPGAGRTYGYGKAARQQFQQLTGVDPLKISPSDRNLWARWTEFRTRQIDSFVSDVAQQMRRIRPSLILSVAVFPLPEHERVQKLQQHWEAWVQRGDVDLVVPMAYATDTNRFQRLVQPYLTTPRLNSSLIMPGIRLLNLPETVTIDQIQSLRDSSSGGYALFAAENFNDRLQTIFKNTQGSLNQAPQQPIPYREPFAAAAVRYASLQQEWEFLREQNQLWMREPMLSVWQNQSKALQQALDALAKEPTRARWNTAKNALLLYQAEFDKWMNLYALENRYQVDAWKARLKTLDTLLTYGDRVTLQRQASKGSK